jgi:hypothetical protein
LISRIIFGEEHRSQSSLLQSLSSPLPCYLVHLMPKDPPLHSIPEKVSLYSSLNVKDQVAHRYKPTGIIIVLYVLSLIFLDSKLEDQRFRTEW